MEKFHTLNTEYEFNKYINKYNNTLRFWKTHSQFDIFPAKKIHKNTKIILVIRNPKDSMVSAFEYYKLRENIRYKGLLGK